MSDSRKRAFDKPSFLDRVAPKAARQGFATLAANLAAIALASWMGTFGWGVSEKTEASAKKQAAAAEAWMKGWPQGAQGLKASGYAQCLQGPSRVCAAIQISAKDLGGNERQETLLFWPEQNWAQAWLPLAQWRLAHEMALAGAQTDFGRQQIARWTRSTASFPELSQRARASGLGDEAPSWRIGREAGPVAGREPLYQDAEDAAWPARAMSELGPVAIFPDGSSLPIKEAGGQWFIWAAGPADRAGRVAAALATGRDSGPGSSPAPQGWRWKSEAQSLGLSEDQAGALETSRQAQDGHERPDLMVAMRARDGSGHDSRSDAGFGRGAQNGSSAGADSVAGSTSGSTSGSANDSTGDSAGESTATSSVDLGRGDSEWSDTAGSGQWLSAPSLGGDAKAAENTAAQREQAEALPSERPQERPARESDRDYPASAQALRARWSASRDAENS